MYPLVAHWFGDTPHFSIGPMPLNSLHLRGAPNPQSPGCEACTNQFPPGLAHADPSAFTRGQRIKHFLRNRCEARGIGIGGILGIFNNAKATFSDRAHPDSVNLHSAKYPKQLRNVNARPMIVWFDNFVSLSHCRRYSHHARLPKSRRS